MFETNLCGFSRTEIARCDGADICKPEHLPQPEVIPLPHEAMKPLGYIVQVLALYTPYVHTHILYKIHERTIRTSPSRCLTSAT